MADLLIKVKVTIFAEVEYVAAWGNSVTMEQIRKEAMNVARNKIDQINKVPGLSNTCLPEIDEITIVERK